MYFRGLKIILFLLLMVISSLGHALVCQLDNGKASPTSTFFIDEFTEVVNLKVADHLGKTVDFFKAQAYEIIDWEQNSYIFANDQTWWKLDTDTMTLERDEDGEFTGLNIFKVNCFTDKQWGDLPHH